MKRLVSSGLVALVGLTAALVPASADARPRTGSVIVFVSDRDSPPGEVQDDLYAYDAGTSTTSRLTDTPDAENAPAVSPSGRYLAYLRYDGVEFCRFRATTNGWACDVTRRVAFVPAQVGRVVWTPDERSVVFAAQGPGEPDTDIFRARLSGVAPAENLTDEAAGAPELPDVQPTVSPDGRQIYFSRAGDLWRVRTAGRGLTQLTSTPAPTNEFGAELSPDDQRLAFHSNRKAPANPATDDFDVYVMRAAPESPTNVPVDVTTGVTAPDGSPSRERFPSFSPDGTRIAFWWSVGGGQADLDSGEIWAVRTDGADPVNLTANNPTEPGVPSAGDIFPDWGHVRG